MPKANPFHRFGARWNRSFRVIVAVKYHGVAGRIVTTITHLVSPRQMDAAVGTSNAYK